MAKRLTQDQKDNILKSFFEGKTIEELSKIFNCTKLTISRNLKRNLGEKKYREITYQNKKEKTTSVKDSLNDIESIAYSEINTKNLLNDNIHNQGYDQSDNFQVTPFLELTPLDCEIENLPRKEFSSVSLTKINLPKTVFMIVDKQIELEIKLLKEFPEWSFLPIDDLNRKAIEIFYDLRNAKRLCKKEQKVIKVPNTNVFRIVSPILISRGISRIVSEDKLIAL